MFKTEWRGDFVEKIKARADRWASAPKISAAITVPPTLDWVLYQEHGIAGHKIVPNESSLLVLPGPVFKEEVDWPGTIHINGGQGTHTIGTVAETLQAAVGEKLPTIFAEGKYDPEAVKEQFLTAVMPAIKQEIVEQMAADLPGTREANPLYPKQGGRLSGRTAASVFEEESLITDKTGE